MPIKLHRHKIILATILALVFLGAITVRVVAYHQANAGATVWMHLWQETDMHYFDNWAHLVSDGDYLSTELEAPLHGWQVRLAEIYAQRHHGLIASRGPFTREHAATIWAQWMPPGSFYQDPLYAYCMAFFYATIGNEHRAILIFQQLLGLATLGLFYLVTRRCMGRTVATISAALAVAYPLAVFYELFLLRESFILFFSFLLIYLVQKTQRHPCRPMYFLCGASAGVAILLKSSLLVLIALLLVGYYLTRPNDARKHANFSALALFLAGITLVLTPLAYRNFQCGLPLLGLSKEGAIVFALHNVASYPPMGGDNFSDELLINVADVAERSNFEILPTITATIDTHGSLGAYLLFTLKKFSYLWSWFEIPSNENFYYSKLHIPVLSYLPFCFQFVMSLGVVGLALSVRRWRKYWPLYALIVTNLFFLTFFLNLARLRLPLAVALIPFAALTMISLLTFLRQKRHVRFCAVLIAVSALFLFAINWPSAQLHTIRADDYIEPFEIFYWPQVEQLKAAGDYRSAAKLCDNALLAAPDQAIDALFDKAQINDPDEFDILYNFAIAYEICGELQERLGQQELSRSYLTRGHRMKMALDNQTGRSQRQFQPK